MERRGKYKRTEEHKKKAKKYLDLGRTKEVRDKVKEKLKENAKDPEWRLKVSASTREAMRRPEVRKKHLEALKKAREKHGLGFKGGNGQEPTPVIKYIESILKPFGYKTEYPIKTKGHGTKHKKVPPAYKADFANPKLKVVYEVDGYIHNNIHSQIGDQKKQEVLEALGWTVKRIKHKGPNDDSVSIPN